MPRADKAAFIQGMLSEHQPSQQREATKPAPDSKEWWRDVAQGLGVELAALRATIAEQAATIARLEAGPYYDGRTTIASVRSTAGPHGVHMPVPVTVDGAWPFDKTAENAAYIAAANPAAVLALLDALDAAEGKPADTVVVVGALFRTDDGRIVRVSGMPDGITVCRDHRGRVAVRNIATNRLSYFPEGELKSMPLASIEP